MAGMMPRIPPPSIASIFTGWFIAWAAVLILPGWSAALSGVMS
jgi:hypothetical protein